MTAAKWKNCKYEKFLQLTVEYATIKSSGFSTDQCCCVQIDHLDTAKENEHSQINGWKGKRFNLVLLLHVPRSKHNNYACTSEITQMMSLSQFPHIVEQSESHNSYHTPNHIVQYNNTILFNFSFVMTIILSLSLFEFKIFTKGP